MKSVKEDVSGKFKDFIVINNYKDVNIWVKQECLMNFIKGLTADWRFKISIREAMWEKLDEVG